jgi:hypothetical protein
MRGRCKNAIALLLAWARTGLGVRIAAAVFDFWFIDTSLEGATNSPRADAQAHLTGPVSGDWAQQASNLILNMKIVVRDADTGHLRCKSDKSRSRTFDVLLRDDLLVQGRGVF